MKDIPVAVLRQTRLAPGDMAAGMRVYIAANSAGALMAMLMTPALIGAWGSVPVIVAGWRADHRPPGCSGLVQQRRLDGGRATAERSDGGQHRRSKAGRFGGGVGRVAEPQFAIGRGVGLGQAEQFEPRRAGDRDDAAGVWVGQELARLALELEPVAQQAPLRDGRCPR